MQPRSSAPHYVVAVGVLIAFALMGLCILQLFQSRQDALDRARETSRNLALVAERDITRNVELYNLSLEAVLQGLRRPDVMAASPALRRGVLFDHAMTAQYLGSMLVLDAQGNIVLDSQNDVPRHGNFSDRKYFTVHRDRADVGIYVSDPFASRLRGGTPGIVLSRRVSNPDGSFAGVALIVINLEYFHTLFAALALGPHGSISLIGTDGIMVMRQPYELHTIGRDISQAATFRRFRSAPEGSFLERSSIDGVRRLYYFKTLPNL
ncbi:diguanylate cyclase, partial [Burkholderia multivorans]